MTFIVFETAVGLPCRSLPLGSDSAVRAIDKFHPGDHGGGVTPVPIPNTAVKPSSADGTARVAWWESRTLPGFSSVPNSRHLRSPDAQASGLFCCASG